MKIRTTPIPAGAFHPSTEQLAALGLREMSAGAGLIVKDTYVSYENEAETVKLVAWSDGVYHLGYRQAAGWGWSWPFLGYLTSEAHLIELLAKIPC